MPASEAVDPDVVAALRDQVERLKEALRLTQEYVGDELLPRQRGWAWYDALYPLGDPENCSPESMGRDALTVGVPRRASDETFSVDEWRVIATALAGLADQFEDPAMHGVIARLRERAKAAAEARKAWAATIDSRVTLVDGDGAEWDERIHRRLNVGGDDLAGALAHAAARYLAEMVPADARIAHVWEFKCTLR